MGDTFSKLSPCTRNQHEDLSMMLKIKILDRTISLEVQRLNTIMEVKRKICDKEDIPIQQQILVYYTYVLSNSFTLCDYDIQDEAILFLDHEAIQNDIQDRYRIGAQMTLWLFMSRVAKFYINVSSLSLVQELKYKVNCYFFGKSVEYNPIHDHKIANEEILLHIGTTIIQDGTLSNYNIEDGNSLFLTQRVWGGGSVDSCLSHCPQCEAWPQDCAIVKNCFNRNFVKVNYAREYPWLALCNVFNISRNVKQKIQDNSEDNGIRCVDVLHHIFHANSTQTWTTVKLKLSSRYPELAREI